MFVLQKDSGIIPSVLTQILDSCVNGVTLSDPDLEDSPIVYANKAFEDMTGYAQEEIVGRNSCKAPTGINLIWIGCVRPLKTRNRSKWSYGIIARMAKCFTTNLSSSLCLIIMARLFIFSGFNTISPSRFALKTRSTG
jgi:hypothetical protein